MQLTPEEDANGQTHAGESQPGVTLGPPRKPCIAGALALASCSLLGQGVMAAESNGDQDWHLVDAALMYYGEEGRVQAIEAIGTAKKTYADETVLDVKVLLDSLTGASASGAIPQGQEQTFTRPSGDGQYSIAAGETPLDDTFHDTRLQLSANWSQPQSSQWKTNLGLYGSKEFDYNAFGVNAGAERGFNKDNTTLFAGAAYSFDILEPEGGRPKPLSAMVLRTEDDTEASFRRAFALTREGRSDDKRTLDLLLGLTQVLNRRWLLQANYGLSSVEGYLTDPYKFLSQVDAAGVTQAYRYEHRPDSRLKHSFFLMTKTALDSGVVDVSYRYNRDDWRLSSQTLESHYRYYFSGSFYGQLHLRYYRQGAAEFYRPWLLTDQALPEFASADYRIGELTSYTLGLKLGRRLSGDRELAFRLEFYRQQPHNNGTEIPEGLQAYKLFPSVRVISAQISYAF
ncbi:DUF3570 domain-containing protein [Shewanella sp. AS16]|uniref:DUF3570 domain-containing protein n=1 Tax=Shewanella sp. AS16 TaxID=2907625 RepID=UPI001F19D427|nr:DUF3570 domain-containing protein [Shewanella sp. AS16]MCE9687235.1 DUF3570 domain-containing protein [Shewanella sp. AS16]